MNKINYKNLKVDKEDSTVYYNDEVHKYWVKGTENNCISVTQIIHEFTTFDESFWSKYKAVQRLLGEDLFDGPIVGKQKIGGVTKDKRAPASEIKIKMLDSKKYLPEYLEGYGITDEDVINETEVILKEWETKRNESCLRGTAIHKKMEDGHLDGNTEELQLLKLGGSFKTDTSNRIKIGERIVYPELLLSRVSDDGKLRLAGQADLIIIDGFDVYILDYKGLPLDTPILTTNGFKFLESITKDDIIFDKDGNKTTIKNISDIHYNDCYEIEFDNGETIIADHEHRWLISFWRKKGEYKDLVLTTEELIEVLEKFNSTKNTYYQPKILNPKPLNTEDRELPIDPYILGAWLGDGTSAAGSITTGENNNLWKEITRRGYMFGENVSGRTNIQTRTIIGLRTELRKLNLLENKHIPDIYLLASYSQRLDLLRGFMDADGYYNPKRKRFVMATTRECQADYLVSLLSTLGVKPTKIYAKKYCNGKEFDGWDVCFTMRENPFLIRNQEGIEYPKSDKASFRNIISVKKVKTVPTKCLEVSSPSHTFLAGRSLIVTHNTNQKIDTKSYYDGKLKRSQKLKYPLNNLDDCNFMHYSLQLSTYAWMLQKIDPRLNIKLLMLIHIDHDNNITNYECDYLKSDVERMLAFYKKQIEYDEFKRSREKIIF